jgi:ribosomal-protein-alanine N-acetyltransferase
MIRRAVETDILAVSALRDRLFPEDQTDFARELSLFSTRLWLAESEGNLCVGFLLAWVVVDEIHLHLVGVAEEMRGKGVARALLVPFLDPHLGDGMLSCARLEVRRDNEGALALYRSLGFRIVNTRKRYYADGCDAFEMALPFEDGRPAPLASDDP